MPEECEEMPPVIGGRCPNPMLILRFLSCLFALAMASVCAAAPHIAGDPAAKSTISIADAPAGARIQWMLADQEAGPYAALPGVTGERMVVPAAFAGKWARARVTAADGQPVETAPVQIRDVAGNPNVAFMHKRGWGLSFTFDRQYIQR